MSSRRRRGCVEISEIENKARCVTEHNNDSIGGDCNSAGDNSTTRTTTRDNWGERARIRRLKVGGDEEEEGDEERRRRTLRRTDIPVGL